MVNDLSKLSTEELEAENAKLTEERIDIRKQQLAINQELDSRAPEPNLEADTVLSPDGVASEEAVNGLGG